MIQAALIGMYAVIFCMAPILSSKVLQIGPLQLLAGIPFMSLAYMLIDLLNENYGKTVARSAVLSGMLSRMLLYLVIVPFCVMVPAVSEVNGYQEILSQGLKLFLAAEIGIFLSQWVVDIPLFHWMKQKGGKFWIRYNLTTHLSAVLTGIFVITVVFFGNPHISLPNMILTATITRVLLTALFTPLAAGANALIRRYA